MQEQKILNYIFLTKDLQTFLCNDLFMELKPLIPLKLCFNKLNKNTTIRQGNYIKIKQIINNFIKINKNYELKLKQLYSGFNLEEIINSIIVAYVFYIYKTNKNYSKIDIFKNENSVCYPQFSIINLL